MLALTRRAGQSLRIGEDVEVRVVRIEGDRVVLAVAAPRTTPILRAELLAEVAEVTASAAGPEARSAVLAALRPG